MQKFFIYSVLALILATTPICGTFYASAASVPGRLGPGTTGGGDLYVEDFAGSAYLVASYLKSSGQQISPPVSGEVFESTLQTAINQEQILSTDSLVSYQGTPKDAVFTNDPNQIVLYRPHWPLNVPSNSPVALLKARLAAHEIFRMMGLNDNDYQISTQLDLFPVDTSGDFLNDANVPSARAIPILIDATPTNEVGSLATSGFAFDGPSGKAWIEIVFNETQDEQNNGSTMYSYLLNQRALVPDLSYDAKNSQIIYSRDGIVTVCAKVVVTKSFFGSHTEVNPTGLCQILSSVGSQLSDPEFSSDTVSTYQVLFSVSP